MAALFARFGLGKLHELSFLHEFYLCKLLRSPAAARAAAPLAGAFLAVFPVRNKMLVIARKLSA